MFNFLKKKDIEILEVIYLKIRPEYYISGGSNPIFLRGFFNKDQTNFRCEMGFYQLNGKITCRELSYTSITYFYSKLNDLDTMNKLEYIYQKELAEIACRKKIKDREVNDAINKLLEATKRGDECDGQV